MLKGRVITMVTAEPVPKEGTTAEHAEMNFDNRKATDVTQLSF